MAVPFYLAFAALWVLVIFNSLVIVGLVRARGIEGAPDRRTGDHAEFTEDNLTGQPVPAFTTEDVLGTRFSDADLAGRSAAMLFVSPDCSTCGVTLQELTALRDRMDDNVLVVCRATNERCVELAHRYELKVPVVADERNTLSDLFRVKGTPTAVLVEDGRVGSYGHPMSADDLQTQIGVGQMKIASPPGVAAGVDAPRAGAAVTTIDLLNNDAP